MRLSPMAWGRYGKVVNATSVESGIWEDMNLNYCESYETEEKTKKAFWIFVEILIFCRSWRTSLGT